MAKKQTKKSTKKKVKKAPLSDHQKLLAASSYVPFCFIVPMAFGHSSDFIFHHAKQGAMLFLIEIILMVVGIFPILGWIVALVGWVFVVVCMVIGIFHALAGTDFEIPFVRELINMAWHK